MICSKVWAFEAGRVTRGAQAAHKAAVCVRCVCTPFSFPYLFSYPFSLLVEIAGRSGLDQPRLFRLVPQMTRRVPVQ